MMRSTGDRLLAARRERLLGLVAAPAADLHRVVDDLPGAVGVPFLGRRRLEPDVVAAAVGHLGRRGSAIASIAKVCGRHVGELVRDRLVLADRLPPLHALAGPAPADLEADLGACRPSRPGSTSRPVLSVVERDLEAPALGADQVLGRHAHVGERDHRVGERAQAHEVAAVLDLHAGPVGLDDEGADLARVRDRPAITTSSLAIVPFVHQSLVPFRM